MYQLLPFKPNKFIDLDGIKCQKENQPRNESKPIVTTC